jgi:hypothetical protein
LRSPYGFALCITTRETARNARAREGSLPDGGDAFAVREAQPEGPAIERLPTKIRL